MRFLRIEAEAFSLFDLKDCFAEVQQDGSLQHIAKFLALMRIMRIRTAAS